MKQNIFYVDYLLNVYSKPTIWDGEIKKYNYETGTFENIKFEDKNIEDSCIQITIDMARDIIKNVFHRTYSYCLEYNDEIWLEKYEKESLKKIEIKDNKYLLFNYILLKSKMAGLNDEIGIQIYSNFFYNNKNVLVENILNTLNFFIKKKKYWIPNINNELEKEYILLDDIMKKRMSTSNFDFSFFEKRYLELCNNGFIKKIYDYNKSKNKYINNVYSNEEIKNFILKYYKFKINEFLDILTEKYEYFRINVASRTMIYQNMEEIVRYVIKFW